jgi:hypothetical protein
MVEMYVTTTPETEIQAELETLNFVLQYPTDVTSSLIIDTF